MNENEPLTLQEVIDNHIRSVLDLKRGNRTHAARVLGVNRRSLLRWIQKTGYEYIKEEEMSYL
jgi:DNA-binding protein Fis